MQALHQREGLFPQRPVINETCALIVPPDKNILRNRHIRNLNQLLMDNADSHLIGVQWFVDMHLLSSQVNLAGSRRLHAGQNFHQRRLSCPVFSAQTQNLAALQRQCDIIECLDAAKLLANVSHLKNRFFHVSPPVPFSFRNQHPAIIASSDAFCSLNFLNFDYKHIISN